MVKKVIVYGFGKCFHELESLIVDCEIIAVADKKATELNSERYQLIIPGDIVNFEYDYVAISSFGYFHQIKQQLIGENGVDPEKICSLYTLVNGQTKYDEVAKEVNAKDRSFLEELYGKQNVANRKEMLEGQELKRFSLPYQNLYVNLNSLLPYKVNEKNDINIFVVTHKDYHVPEDGLYKPIAVGGYSQAGWLDDYSGDNISDLNPKINECTAIYWIWKNVNADIVGINHYRRFFYNNDLRCRENMLSKWRIEELLKEYDLIAYQGVVPNNWTIAEEMQQDLEPEVYSYGYECILEGVKEYQPDYIDAFIQTLREYQCYYCNMLVAPKEIFDKYCEWLFSFLIPVARSADVTDFDAKNSRIIGFFAERMFTVWLSKQSYNVKALPVYIP